jgi:pimeloyl-ACP methyl ester carboxylesterase
LGQQGIVGVGHSLGGVLTLWAAIRRPELFRAVVLIDPVVFPPTWLWGPRVLRWLRLERHQPLVQGALRRRRSWPSRRACYDHLRGKPLFARWSDAALLAYVESGTRGRADGQVELIYPPEWEAHIFATTPTDIWHDVPQLRTPALVIRGQDSFVFQTASQARMARLLPQARFVTIPDAGHLVPMERPIETGTVIADFLEGRGP